MPHPLAAFYRGKRVLVTGHTGFQGGWLVAWLKLLGGKVLGYALPPSTRPNFFDATFLDRGITSVFGDVRDRNTLANAFTDFQPEIVIHCAWQSGQRRASREPVETFATNVMGAVHVLDEARLTTSVRGLALATSESYCADHNDVSGTSEEDADAGNNPYAATVAAAALASSAYQQSFFQNRSRGVATARLANTIGGGDWAGERLVPNIVREITSGDLALLNCSDGLRQWQHVLESGHALLVLGQSLYEHGHTYSGVWNFTPAEEAAISERELGEKFVKSWGAEVPFASTGEAPDEAHSHILNGGKAQGQLGWRTIFELDEAIARTVDWYRAFYADPASAWRTTEEQIQQYMKRVS
jgi:CDP-glucose 4,6-dehydratase